MVLGGILMKISVKKVIDSNIAVSASKGELLFKEVSNALLQNDYVELDFSEITDLTTAFLNVAIGHLYKNFSSEELNEKLKLLNLDELDMYLVTQVIQRVKKNEEEEEEFKQLIKEVLDDGESSSY